MPHPPPHPHSHPHSNSHSHPPSSRPRINPPTIPHSAPLHLSPAPNAPVIHPPSVRMRGTYRPYMRSTHSPMLGWTPRPPGGPHIIRGGRGGGMTTARGGMTTARGGMTTVRGGITKARGGAVVGTPSWLTGGYRGNVEMWCKERMELIRLTVEGKMDGVPELTKVMEDLDCDKMEEEMELLAKVRTGHWRIRERFRRGESEVRKVEREVGKYEMMSRRIESKVRRLQGYAGFIEGGWKDESVLWESVGGEGKREKREETVKQEEEGGDASEEMKFKT